MERATMAKPYSYCVVILVSLLLSATTSCSSNDAIWGSSAAGYCCGAEIRIYQWPSGFGARNIPKFNVLIVNEAWGAPSGVFDVHISCGEFASASLINPLLFRRVAAGDCLVKNGKLLYPGSSNDAIWGSSAAGYCCGAEIRIYQWPSGFGARNVPKFNVLIVNEAWDAPSGVFDVHISCGEFASASLINPLLFHRVAAGDCLVKNGKLLYPGEVISFQYANILPYPLAVLQVRC